MENKGRGGRSQHSRNEASPHAHDPKTNSLIIISEAINSLKRVSQNTTESVDSASTSGATELPVDTLEKELLLHKIKSCSEFLANLIGHNTGRNELSYQSALVLIYVVETFALQATGDEGLNDMLAGYLAPNYTKDIDREKFRVVRKALLKQTDKKLKLEDVRACIKVDDINSFFQELHKYTQHVLKGMGQANTQYNNDTGPVLSLDELLEIPKSKFGEIITDVESFLATEFDKLLVKAFTKNNWSLEDLFDFIVVFFPMFKEKSQWHCQKLGLLRNRLLHHFNEYENIKCVPFGNAIVGMRHELLKYYFAKEVYKIIHKIEHVTDDIKIDEELEKISKHSVVDNVRAVGDVTQHAAENEAKVFHGYKFSKSMLPDEVTNFKDLAYQYFKFKFLTHHFIEKEEEQKNKNSIKATNSQSMTKLIGSERQEMFEEFCELEMLRTESKTKKYSDKKKRFKERMVTKYGVKKNHFDGTFKYFEEHDGKIIIKSGSDGDKSVAKILTTLKEILKRNPKLSNYVIINLYDRFVTRRAVFDSRESKKLLKNVANDRDRELRSIETEMKQLPEDKKIMLQIDNTTLFVPTGEVIRDMLYIFCDAYNTYRVEFGIKDIFNDGTILDFMARKETEEVDVVVLVEQYFKFIPRLRIASTSVRLTIRDVVERFLRLKQILKAESNPFYEKEKIKLGKELMKEYRVKETDFNEVCQSFVESDEKLTVDEMNNVKEVQSVIHKLKTQSSREPFNSAIVSSYKNAINCLSDCKNEKEFIDKIPKNEKKFAKPILKFFNESKSKSRSNVELLRDIGKEFPYLLRDEYKDSLCEQLRRGRVDNYLTENPEIVANINKTKDEIIERLRDLYKSADFEKLKLVGEQLGKSVGDVLATFKDKLKLKVHNKERIKKLLNITYAAPYIVRLLKNVRSDEIMDIDDLKKLIGIFLNDEDNSYIRHLNDLLYINSGRLNLYGEVCTQIVEPSYNIENMLDIFNEPTHVDGILTALNEGKNLGDKTDEVLKEVLTLLNSVVLELILFNAEDTALEILSGEMQETFGRLINEKKMKLNDPIFINYQLNFSEVRNAKGKKTIERTLHEEALEILEKVEKVCVNDDGTDYGQYLLVLCFKAYTKKLLEQYEQSYKMYKDVFEKIVKFVLTIDVDASVAYNNKEFYGDMEKSEKYFELRESSEVSQRYLDILDIAHNMGYTILSHAIANSKSQDNIEQVKPNVTNVDVTNCKESLKIYEGLCVYTEEKLGSNHQDSVQLMRQLGRTHSQTGMVILRHLKSSPDRVQDYGNVLQHLRDGLIVNNRILKIQLKKDNKYHIPFKHLKTHFMVKDILKLASIHNNLGWALPRDDLERESHYQDALNIYEKMYLFQKSIRCDQEDELKIVNNIASTYNNLGLCVFRKQTARESSYRKALEKYKEAYELTKNIYTSESRDYIKACLKVADINFRLYFLMKPDVALQHYNESIDLYSKVQASPLASVRDISFAGTRIASLRAEHNSRSN